MSDQTNQKPAEKSNYGFWAVYLGMIVLSFCAGVIGQANIHKLYAVKAEYNPISCMSGFKFANTQDGLVLVVDQAGNKIPCQ